MKKMTILILAIIAGVSFSSCDQKKEIYQWEYKTLSIVGDNPVGQSKNSIDTEADAMNAIADGLNQAKLASRTFSNQDKTLNDLGMQGWELIDVYTLVETVHPNYGDLKYVSGLQPNVRTSNLLCI